MGIAQTQPFSLPSFLSLPLTLALAHFFLFLFFFSRFFFNLNPFAFGFLPPRAYLGGSPLLAGVLLFSQKEEAFPTFVVPLPFFTLFCLVHPKHFFPPPPRAEFFFGCCSLHPTRRKLLLQRVEIYFQLTYPPFFWGVAGVSVPVKLFPHRSFFLAPTRFHFFSLVHFAFFDWSTLTFLWSPPRFFLACFRHFPPECLSKGLAVP